MTEQQFAALIAVLGRIAIALEAQSEPEDEKLTFPLSDYAAFDWASIGATVIQRDSDGVSVIRAANGKMCKRRSNDKFGTEIWFSYSTGKAEDGTPTYSRVIEFRQVQPPEPLGRKTEQALKQAAHPPASNAAPAKPPEQPPTVYETWAKLYKQTLAQFGLVPVQYGPETDDNEKSLTRKIDGLTRYIANGGQIMPEPLSTESSRRAEIKTHLDQLAARGRLLGLTMTDDQIRLANSEPLELGEIKIGTLTHLMEVAEKKQQPAHSGPASSVDIAIKTIAANARAHKQNNRTASKAQVGEVYNALRAATNMDEAARRHVQQILTGSASLNDMPGEIQLALHGWLKPRQNGAWHIGQDAEKVIAGIVAAMPQPEAQPS